MRSPFRWLRRKFELAQQAPRRREIEAEFSQFCGCPVKLTNADAKGGYDEIYFAQRGSERFAVVRVNSPFKSQIDPIGEFDPGVPLDASGRLNREWDAYRVLYPLGLSPQPLWRSSDAIACSWVPWDRVAKRLIQNRQEFWPLLVQIFPAIRRMHEAGVTHLDLNLGNLLTEPNGDGIALIDFEFGPVAWVNPAQQRAFDYLRLIDDCTKPRRGGHQMLSDLDQLHAVISTTVDTEALQSEIAFTRKKLVRLEEHSELLKMLRSLFVKL
ncbi:lipopolysaccharide kinase InaA family protein [Planctomicrobium sp. SH668]|uniref:lipopolysaccharide kinase InaA family protein n=1 Tax=Planctomicrobium sp. SH668 TaxID=3448126 RepID=UPI003F5B20E9